MLQLSFFELDEINTYGFFNINLNIVMSVCIILFYFYYLNMSLFESHNDFFSNIYYTTLQM